MSPDISETEARLALDSVAQRRREVIAEIDVPRWYWLFVASGWVLLGVLADFAPAWATLAATILFGAMHSTIASRVLSGRRASNNLSIRGDLVSRWIPTLVIGFLLVMTAATVILALVFDADGARHPATLASVVVALLVMVGGPALMAWIRHRAQRRLS